jgi:chromosomal replication initiator protein
MMNLDQAWQSVLTQLQSEMPKASFDTWVSDTRPLALENGSLRVGTPNAYARDWLESRLSSTIRRLLVGILDSNIAVDFVVWQAERGQAPVVDSHTEDAATGFVAPDRHSSLNPRYTFDNFVVGAGNRLAHAACLAVAEKPAKAYNPLFLYGGVGLGKTHLLHAIGNACSGRGLNVLYVSSEEFTNEIINAIRTHTTQAFREKYRSADVLLVDDIQFIAGKESTQEEFFHTFNTLHGQDKQIIVSSDRPPRSLVTLEERMRSRFEWGLAADIQPPDLETRLAILRAKAERTGRLIPDDILETIARRVESNIRELEGALNRILAWARSLPQDRGAAPGRHVPHAQGNRRLSPADRGSPRRARPHDCDVRHRQDRESDRDQGRIAKTGDQHQAAAVRAKRSRLSCRKAGPAVHSGMI